MALSQITVQELAALGPGVRLIDVREQHEWDQGHVPYAVHAPLATVPASLDRFDGDPTYVICRSGGRSAHASEYAGANGRPAVNVAGGMLAWIAAGYETVGAT